MFRKAILAALLLSVCAATQAQYLQQFGRWKKPYVSASYEMKWCDDEQPTIMERVTITVHIDAEDVGLPGMVYVGALSRSSTASVLNYPYGVAPEDDGLMDSRYGRRVFGRDEFRHHSPHEWTPWRGGIPDPTIAYEGLPRSRTFVIHSSPCGAPRACDRILEMTGGDVEIGGAYGAVQPEDQVTIDRMAEFEHLQLSLDHMKAAFAYNDGLQNERYGVGLTFRCDQSYVPEEFRHIYEPESN